MIKLITLLVFGFLPLSYGHSAVPPLVAGMPLPQPFAATVSDFRDALIAAQYAHMHCPFVTLSEPHDVVEAQLHFTLIGGRTFYQMRLIFTNEERGTGAMVDLFGEKVLTSTLVPSGHVFFTNYWNVHGVFPPPPKTPESAPLQMDKLQGLLAKLVLEGLSPTATISSLYLP